MYESLCLRTIFDLRVDPSGAPRRYYIPGYQRGYRWTPTQVTQLLEDVREFAKRTNPTSEDFYCLQPLVLRPNAGGAYEVVDGQQRLTTILLILRHFNERLALRYQLKHFQLEYETRPDLMEFLADPSAERAELNIDFFHIFNAAHSISTWFENLESEVEEIKAALLNKTKIIWYELSPEERAIAAFTRLNVGKIPLTNGELIRALFLRRRKKDSTGQAQLQIAHEWDSLEKRLQDSDFWTFLSNETTQRGGRIDYVFDMVARQDGMTPSADQYATFNHFSQKLGGEDVDIELEWRTLKKTFMLLEEWFADRRLFHLVGYLIWVGEDVNSLYSLAAGVGRMEFRKRLKLKILEYAFGPGSPPTPSDEWITDRLDSLVYTPGSIKLRRILLLFNLATLLRNETSNVRFQFESFKTAEWDIEHVRSLASDRPGTQKGKSEWLRQCESYLESVGEAPELLSDIRAFVAAPPNEQTETSFDRVYGNILRHFVEETEVESDNGIFNLVLLDYSTNRSYRNAVFAVKRYRIVSQDRDGVFVPICTRNVFLKCYNPQVTHLMYWTQDDKDGYRSAMITTFTDFFGSE